MTGSWKGRGNQYIEFVRDLYCKLRTNAGQLPAFPLEAVSGTEPRPRRWEARVLHSATVAPVNTIMSCVYIQPNIINGQGKYNQKYDTKLHGMCLCDSQYYNGQNTNTNIYCTQQSAHSCQVSNSSLDIQ